MSSFWNEPAGSGGADRSVYAAFESGVPARAQDSVRVGRARRLLLQAIEGDQGMCKVRFRFEEVRIAQRRALRLANVARGATTLAPSEDVARLAAASDARGATTLAPSEEVVRLAAASDARGAGSLAPSEEVVRLRPAGQARLAALEKLCCEMEEYCEATQALQLQLQSLR